MPHLRELSVDNFRNLRSTSAYWGPKINVILGPNGAGKSSFLESLSVLAHGRSFRTHKHRNLIRDDGTKFTIFGRVVAEGDRGEIPVGIERSRNGQVKIKLDNRVINSSAELASTIPLIVISSQSFRLLEGGPKDRRRFFDWLVFHVKHEFSQLWKSASRCLKHRNSLLRSGKISYSELEPWDIEISRVSRDIDALRRECCDQLRTKLFDLTRKDCGIFGGDYPVDLEYISGWNQGFEYEKQLREQFDKDIRYGYTTLGPHKADLRVMFGKHTASDILSRGQLKILITSLYVAEAHVLVEQTGQVPVVAIDDLPSELDEVNQNLLGNWLVDLGCQVFATGINGDFIKNTWSDSLVDVKVFHVKHGELV